MSKKLPEPERLHWSRIPTPVHRLNRLSEEYGVNLFVKRDDLTGFALGGNKIRKLDYLLHDAVQQEATALISCGGLQSNHCRAVAALAAHYGLESILILRGEKPKSLRSNLLLDHLFGAQIFYVSDEEYKERDNLRRIIEEQIRDRGGKAYYIPEGGSNPIGTFGYVNMWRELQSQLGTKMPNYEQAVPEKFNSIVFANGSGGTQAGLLLGRLLEEESPDTKIVGVNVCYDKAETFRLVKDLLWQTITRYALPVSFMTEDIEILDGFLGEGYAISRREELDCIAYVARQEGVLLDPVYSGKAMYGLLESLKKSQDRFGKDILFVHTGGGFGNFKIEQDWTEVFLSKK